MELAKRAAWVAVALFVLASIWPTASLAQDNDEFPDVAMKGIMEPWKGDLDGMIQRRVIRALVVYSKTNYFLDGATKRGITYEYLMNFEKQLNKTLKTKHHERIHIIMVPVARDRLIPDLLEGRGDVAAAMLTETQSRKKQVDFAAPFAANVKELVVTGPGAPPLSAIEDLSGKLVYVRASSSYYGSLLKLNAALKKAGKPPVRIEPANENLETEDILEMVNAGLLQITVADDYLANFWSKIFKDIKVHQNLALRAGGRIAWAVRKGSPQLVAAIDKYVRTAKQGSLQGNILIQKYLQNTRWASQAITGEDLARFKQTIGFFRKYAGQYGFDYLMVTALAYQESRLDQTVKSPVGAVGVMQILPSTAAGHPVNIPDVQKLEKNIHAGTKYLRFIYDEYFKDEKNVSELNKVLFTFASYNAGPARVAQLRQRAVKMGLDPNLWFKNVERAAARVIGRETVQYVSNIFKYYLAYKMIVDQQGQRKAAREEVGK